MPQFDLWHFAIRVRIMKYYIYLLQIFGGGNPKIHEIIRAYGSARAASEKVLKGDMTLIPANRIENVRKASLEKSDQIIKFCRDNKISIVTIDDKAYPKMLKNIYNPPTVLFVEGDLSCLQNYFSLSVVGPRKPDSYAVRLAMNICGGLAGCKTMLVSGFAFGIDSIAHTECIKRNIPTVAVLACGHTIEYPAHSFSVRAQVKKSGGAVISELLPDTECCKGYFKHRNRIISGLTYGTVVIGADNRSGSLLTANNAFDQDRDLFFTMPPDTLDEKYSRVIRYLRDGAHAVYDFYDIINEYYELHKDKLDDTHLDKNRLSSYSAAPRIEIDDSFDAVEESLGNDTPTFSEGTTTTEEKSDESEFPEENFEVFYEKKQSKTQEKDVLKEIVDRNIPITEEMVKSVPSDSEVKFERDSKKKTRKRKEKKVVPPEKRFSLKAGGESKPPCDYSLGTPGRFQKKKKGGAVIGSESVQPVQNAENTRSLSNVNKILDFISRGEGVTTERIMTTLDLDYSVVIECLSDLELDGAIIYHPGGVYTLSEES